MKRVIVLSLTFLCVLVAALFSLGAASGFTGFVVSDVSQTVSVNQIFSMIFLFLGLGIFIVGLLHD